MRDHMERFVLLPFSGGCISESGIAVGLQQQAKRSKLDINSTPTREKEEEEDEYDVDNESLKSPLSLPRVQKLFKNFKNLSQLFVYKDDLEEMEMGMEIGLPTDVKHVTHIGVDSCATSILSNGWTNNLNQTELINLPLADKPTVRSLLLETK